MSINFAERAPPKSRRKRSTWNTPPCNSNFTDQSTFEIRPDVPRGTLWKPGPNIPPTPAIHAKYNYLVPALESGIAKARNPNYAALKSLDSP